MLKNLLAKLLNRNPNRHAPSGCGCGDHDDFQPPLEKPEAVTDR